MESNQDLVYRSSDPAFLLGADGRIVAWNGGAQTLLGYGAEEVVGQPCWRVLRGVTPTGEPVCTPACAAIACFQRGLPFGAPELQVRHKDGQTVPVSLSTLLLPHATAPNGTGPLALIFLRPTAPSSPAARLDVLRLYCLGPFRVLRGAQPVDWSVWKRKQAVTLLALLAHHRGQPVHRELVLEALWPEAPVEAALKRLKVVVYSLRRELGDAEGAYIVRRGPFYALEPANVWIDVIAFEEFLERGLRMASRDETDAALVSLEAARGLYRGGYLEEERYTDWAQMERARLAERYLDLLRTLGALHGQQGRHDEAVRTYRLALAQDPCREDLHRLLARALAALGERAQALQQLQRCEEALRTQLGVAPSVETRALRDALFARA